MIDKHDYHMPPPLQQGDSVTLVAPGRKVTPGDVDFAIKTLTSWDLNVKTGQYLFSQRHSYMSGTDDERRIDLQAALNDSDCKAIICARGGYGTTRILDQLDFSSFLKNPKWLVGFSDITALHLQLSAYRVASIHGIMPVLFPKEDATESIAQLKKTLFENTYTLIANADNQNRFGESIGVTIGGNLSLFVDALGTRSEPDTEGKILVIEEVDEHKYKVDRMLTQLKRTGKLASLAGLVVGHFTQLKDPAVPFGESLQQIVMDKVNAYSYPVAFGFTTGHENPNNPWICGARSELIVDERGATLQLA